MDSYTVAMSAGKDKANWHMRKHGRVAWSIEDQNIAYDEFSRLYGAKVSRAGNR